MLGGARSGKSREAERLLASALAACGPKHASFVKVDDVDVRRVRGGYLVQKRLRVALDEGLREDETVSVGAGTHIGDLGIHGDRGQPFGAGAAPLFQAGLWSAGSASFASQMPDRSEFNAGALPPATGAAPDIYYFVLEGCWGASLGKRLMGLRVSSRARSATRGKALSSASI